MLPYKIRKPVYGGSKRSKSKSTVAKNACCGDGSQAASTAKTHLFGNEDDDPRIYGGNLQRAILSDLMNLKERFHKLLNDTVSKQVNGASIQHYEAGKYFAHFKAAFKEARFGCIHNRAAPIRIDRGEFAQLIYSSCFYLLQDTFSKRGFELDTLVAITDDGMNCNFSTESRNFLVDAIFPIFALYTLHQTSTLPKDPYTTKETFNHPSMQYEKDLHQQWSYLPLGAASEGKIFRRYYKSPVRIDRCNYLSLLHIQDVCAAIVAKCKLNSKNSDLPCSCSLATDGLHLIDRIMKDDNFFVFCEYNGPVGLEGLAGNPIFYNAYYGVEKDKAAKKRGNRVEKMHPVASTSNVLDSQWLNKEKLRSCCQLAVKISDDLELIPLSNLLSEHKSNLQLIETELQTSRYRHHESMRQPASDDNLKPRQRELVENTLREIWTNEVGTEHNPSYAAKINDLCAPNAQDMTKLQNDNRTRMSDKHSIEEQQRLDQSNLATSNKDETVSLPIEFPASFSHQLSVNINSVLSDFSEVVESVRKSLLRDKANTFAGENGDFSALDIASSLKRSVNNIPYDEVSSTGEGKKALAALLSMSERGNQKQNEDRSEGFLNLQDVQSICLAEVYVEENASSASDWADEFSVSTGAGKNALSALLSTAGYGNKKKRKIQLQYSNFDTNDNIMNATKAFEEEDSSVSDSSAEVSGYALHSLFRVVDVNDEVKSKQGDVSSKNSLSRCITDLSKGKLNSNLNDDDISEATGGGKRALTELLSSMES